LGNKLVVKKGKEWMPLEKGKRKNRKKKGENSL